MKQFSLKQHFLLLFVSALIYLPFNGLMELVHEEPRRVVIAQNMIDSGDYIIPQMNAETYMAKPPLQNWLIIATSAPFGEITVHSARLATWLAAIALVYFMLWLTAGRLIQLTQVFLACSLLLSPHLASKIGLAEIEIAFVLLVTAGLWTWWHLYEQKKTGPALWILPSVITGLSFLAKREPSLVFYYLPIFALLLWKRQLAELFRPGHFIGAAIILSFTIIWPLPVISDIGLDKFLENMSAEVVSRGGGNFFQYITHFISYPLEIWASQFPFSAPLIFLFSKNIRTRLIQRHGDFFHFAWIVILVNLLPYLSRPDIATRYFMPMHPTILLLSALVLNELTCWARENSSSIGKALKVSQHATSWIFLSIGTLLFIAGVAHTFDTVFELGHMQKFGLPWLPTPIAILTFLAGLSALVGLCLYRSKLVLGAFLTLSLIYAGAGWRYFELQLTLPQKSKKLDAREQLTPDFQQMQEFLAATSSIRPLKVYIPTRIEAKLWFYDPENLFESLEIDEVIATAYANNSAVWVLHDSNDRTIKNLEKRDDIVTKVDQKIPHRSNTYHLTRIELKQKGPSR